MDEVKFAVKTFLASILIVLGLQVRISGETLENRMYLWVEASPVSNYLTKVAEGGALAIKNGWSFTKTFVGNVLNEDKSAANAEQAKASK